MTFKGYLLLFGGVTIWLIACFWGESYMRRRLDKKAGDRGKGP